MSVDPTATVRLGRGEVECTRMGLGTAPLGNLFELVSEEEALETVVCAVRSGLRLVDTAPLYGHGIAERRVGRALGRLGVECPADLVLATKVGRLLREGAPPDPTQWQDGNPIYAKTLDAETLAVNPVFDFSADGVRRSLEESLERAGRERFDIVHLHDPDDHFDQALHEALPALEELRTQGRIRAVSVGMNQAEMLVRFAEQAALDCVLLAGRYSLLDTSGSRELLPLCAERGIGVLIGGVFNSGILADPSPESHFDYRRARADVLARAEAMAEVCLRHDVALKAAAIQFPFANGAVTSVLVGARTRDELEECLRLARTPLPAALWDELQECGLLDASVPVPGEGMVL